MCFSSQVYRHCAYSLSEGKVLALLPGTNLLLQKERMRLLSSQNDKDISNHYLPHD